MYCLSSGVYDIGEDAMLVKMAGKSKPSYIKNSLLADRNVLKGKYP